MCSTTSSSVTPTPLAFMCATYHAACRPTGVDGNSGSPAMGRASHRSRLRRRGLTRASVATVGAVPIPSSPPDIRPLTKPHLPSTVASAARAFHDDPLFNFFEPNLLKQAHRLPALMRATIVDTLPLHETYAAFVDGKAKAVAAWMPPGTYPRTPRREALFLARAAPAMIRTGRRLAAALKLLAAIDKVHP